MHPSIGHATESEGCGLGAYNGDRVEWRAPHGDSTSPPTHTGALTRHTSSLKPCRESHSVSPASHRSAFLAGGAALAASGTSCCCRGRLVVVIRAKGMAGLEADIRSPLTVWYMSIRGSPPPPPLFLPPLLGGTSSRDMRESDLIRLIAGMHGDSSPAAADDDDAINCGVSCSVFLVLLPIPGVLLGVDLNLGGVLLVKMVSKSLWRSVRERAPPLLSDRGVSKGTAAAAGGGGSVSWATEQSSRGSVGPLRRAAIGWCRLVGGPMVALGSTVSRTLVITKRGAMKCPLSRRDFS